MVGAETLGHYKSGQATSSLIFRGGGGAQEDVLELTMNVCTKWQKM
jgi:hypothetical protein